MMYVYILQSLSEENHFYTGVTQDLKKRLSAHNSGIVPHTAKFLPWKVKWYCGFEDKHKAFAFEKYLKSGSGRTFVKRHF